MKVSGFDLVTGSVAVAAKVNHSHQRPRKSAYFRQAGSRLTSANSGSALLFLQIPEISFVAISSHDMVHGHHCEIPNIVRYLFTPGLLAELMVGAIGFESAR